MSVLNPNIFYHWKYLRLTQLIGQRALDALCRLWCHCESKQRRDLWPDATPEMVEGVCLWDGEPGLLYKHLLACRWIDELPDGGVCIHGWAEANARLLDCWDAWSKHKAKRPTTRESRRVIAEHSPSALRPVSDNSPSTLREVADPSEPHRASPTPDPSVLGSLKASGGSKGGSAGGSPPGPPKSLLRSGVGNKRSARQLGRVAAACLGTIQRLEKKEREEELNVPELKMLELARRRLSEIQQKQIDGGTVM